MEQSDVTGQKNRTLFLLARIAFALVMLLILLTIGPRAGFGAYYKKQGMPDLGQHSTNWSWVAALANSLYWYSQNGYPELLDDPNTPTFDQTLAEIDPSTRDGAVPPWRDTDSAGYLRLLRKIAESTWRDWQGDRDGQRDPGESTYYFCEPVWDWDYLLGIQAFLDRQGASARVRAQRGLSGGLEVYEIADPARPPEVAGPTGPGAGSQTPYGPGYAPPGIRVTWRPPTFNDFVRELRRSQDVLLWLDLPNVDHVVTGVSYDDVAMQINVADPWTHNVGHDDPGPGAPDHNNSFDTSQNPYEALQVVSTNPLEVIYNGNPVRVIKLIFISPTWSSNKFWFNAKYHNWHINGANDFLVQVRAWAFWPLLKGYTPRVQYAWSKFFPTVWWWYASPWTNIKYAYRNAPISTRIWACFAVWIKPGSFVFFRSWWTVNSQKTGPPLPGFGWKAAAPPTVFLPPEETRSIIIKDVQFANSEGVIPLETLTTEDTAGLAWDTARAPITLNPGTNYEVSDVDLAVPEPSLIPEAQRRTVVAKGIVVFQDEAGNPDAEVPFVVQFGNEAMPGDLPTGYNIFWLATLAVFAVLAGVGILVTGRRLVLKVRVVGK